MPTQCHSTAFLEAGFPGHFSAEISPGVGTAAYGPILYYEFVWSLPPAAKPGKKGFTLNRRFDRLVGLIEIRIDRR
jgi:hypothetical protein